ncbi:hypothetical protein D0962_23405 [Leptolyngbyaceae cyanobacterium CCMR0082]|uniref:Uncharacterized protein n=1 Tax=Adonisia turfae CCMR0082 TaxID=2304604 RepID=A0A6M0SB21_9CYAN|nr:hypothetical protein [Adonisia turfae]NEZ65667.1 hypothetical protein [Adonisia turfae CCMR0082]
MAKPLQDAILPSHAASQKKLVFTKDTEDLNDATATFQMISGDISVVLSSGNGIENLLNTADSQEFKVIISAEDKKKLLNGSVTVDVEWAVSITLPGAAPVTGDDDEAYTGTFTIKATHASA